MKSWKTTLAGVSAAVVAILTLIVNPLIDDNVATNPNYETAIPIIIAGLTGIFAKDHSNKEVKL
jgi:quinol-cytochrome oxidoreductase complex cytochrome b subunit